MARVGGIKFKKKEWIYAKKEKTKDYKFISWNNKYHIYILPNISALLEMGLYKYKNNIDQQSLTSGITAEYQLKWKGMRLWKRMWMNMYVYCK